LNKSQIIAGVVAISLVGILYFGADIVSKKPANPVSNTQETNIISIDSILHYAKLELSPEQVIRINALENSVVRGDVKDQKIAVFHQLAHFWKDSGRSFEPYAWYESEIARLESSEKSLNFAAHLFLDNLRSERNMSLKKWKAIQAKDLFERSLSINPDNDSSNIGLGSCYIFGGISDNPMEGILKIRKVIDKDSSNVYANMMLGYGSIMSGQYDKAISRFEKIAKMHPDNLEAILNLAEAFEQKGDKSAAINWYEKSLKLINVPAYQDEVTHRIAELKK
jgi:tetratricopeptide (TPR) repeat protein